jgi:hypothetical protein
MAFAFNLNLSVSFSPKTDKGKLPMGKWATEAVDRLQKREKRDQEEEERAAAKRRQIMADAPHMWSQLVQGVNEEVAAFSKLRSGYLSITDQSQSSVNPSLNVSMTGGNPQLNIKFDPNSPRIIYALNDNRGNSKSGMFTFEIFEGQVCLYDNAGTRWDVDAAVEYLLIFLI